MGTGVGVGVEVGTLKLPPIVLEVMIFTPFVPLAKRWLVVVEVVVAEVVDSVIC